MSSIYTELDVIPSIRKNLKYTLTLKLLESRYYFEYNKKTEVTIGLEVEYKIFAIITTIKFKSWRLPGALER